MIRFIFDLDGTLTKEETLPKIAQYFGIEKQIDSLTKDTILGNIPFVESFIYRVNILGKLPVDKIANLLSQIEIYEKVTNFIQTHPRNCAIATGNLECWVNKLTAQFNCDIYASSGILRDNQVIKLDKIFKKEALVKQYQAQGEKVIFIGDGNNDVEAMRLANISIASGLTHKPAPSVLSVVDYAIFSEEALCRLLNQLL